MSDDEFPEIVIEPQSAVRNRPRRPPRPSPRDSPQGTMLARIIAANIDALLVIVISGGAAKLLPETWLVWQIVTFLGCYCAYFLVLEWCFSGTPGKYLTGLRIRDYQGRPCTLQQSLIRTIFRLFEANPLMGLPAAISIVFSRDKQRFGDRVAGTVVVPVRPC